jgi:hypothetical protein
MKKTNNNDGLRMKKCLVENFKRACALERLRAKVLIGAGALGQHGALELRATLAPLVVGRHQMPIDARPQ